MRKRVLAVTAALTTVLVAIWLLPGEPTVHPAPAGQVPTHMNTDGRLDFAAYPQPSDAEKYRTARNPGFPIDGFHTSDGIVCMNIGHRAMYFLDCVGPFVGLPDGANHVQIYSPSASISMPPEFSHSEEAISSEFYGVGAKDTTLMPRGELFVGLNSVCVQTDDIVLACQAGDTKDGAGFIATRSVTTTYSRPTR